MQISIATNSKKTGLYRTIDGLVHASKSKVQLKGKSELPKLLKKQTSFILLIDLDDFSNSDLNELRRFISDNRTYILVGVHLDPPQKTPNNLQWFDFTIPFSELNQALVQTWELLIKERQQTHLTLQESEFRYQSLHENIQLIVWTADSEGNIDYINPFGHAYFGTMVNDLLNSGWLSIIHPDDVAGTKEKWSKCLEKSQEYKHQFRVEINGEYRWIEAQAFLQKDTKGKPVKWIGMSHDIHENKKSQIALEKSETRFRNLIEYNSAGMVISKNEEHKIDYISPSVKRILGYEVNELIGKPLLDKIHPDDRQGYLDTFFSVRDGKTELGKLDMRILHKNGTYRWVSKTLSDQRKIKGVNNFVDNMKDIHQEKSATQALRKSHQKYKLVSKSVSDIIYDYDLMKKYGQYSESYTEVFGYHDTSIQLKIWEGRIHPKDRERVISSRKKALNDASTNQWRANYLYKHNDGSYFYIEDNAHIVRNVNGQAVQMVGAFSDQTKRYEYEQSIEEQNAKLRDIAWTQSHLVRAPLANLMAFINLIKDTDPDSEDRAKIDEGILSSAKKLDDMIRTTVKNTQHLKFKRPIQTKTVTQSVAIPQMRHSNEK